MEPSTIALRKVRNYVSELIVERGLKLYNNNIYRNVSNGRKYGMLSIDSRYLIVYYILANNLERICVRLRKNGNYNSSTKYGFSELLNGSVERRISLNKSDFGEYLVFMDRMINNSEKKSIIKLANRTVKDTYVFLKNISKHKELDVHSDSLIDAPCGKKGNIKYGLIKYGDIDLVYTGYPVRPALIQVRLYKNGVRYFSDEYCLPDHSDGLMNYVELSKTVIVMDDEILKKRRKLSETESYKVPKKRIIHCKMEDNCVHSNLRNNIMRMFRTSSIGDYFM